MCLRALVGVHPHHPVGRICCSGPVLPYVVSSNSRIAVFWCDVIEGLFWTVSTEDNSDSLSQLKHSSSRTSSLQLKQKMTKGEFCMSDLFFQALLGRKLWIKQCVCVYLHSHYDKSGTNTLKFLSKNTFILVYVIFSLCPLLSQYIWKHIGQTHKITFPYGHKL